MKARLHTTSDAHIWELTDASVTQLAIDAGGLRIVTWHVECGADFRLACPFIYTAPDGKTWHIDPEHAEQVAPLLGLVAKSLIGVVVKRSGDLELRFGDGSTISVEPHDRYEAWECRGEGRLEAMNYLCGPGGGAPWG